MMGLGFSRKGELPMSQLLETTDVARLLGVSAERVRQLANVDRLRVSIVTQRGTRLFTLDEVRRFQRERIDRLEDRATRRSARRAPTASIDIQDAGDTRAVRTGT
jgi:hypothetical protein